MLFNIALLFHKEWQKKHIIHLWFSPFDLQDLRMAQNCKLIAMTIQLTGEKRTTTTLCGILTIVEQNEASFPSFPVSQKG